MAKPSKKGSAKELDRFIQTKILLLLNVIPEQAVKAAQEQGYNELQIISSAFGNEEYFDETGKSRTVLRFGKRWRDLKRRKSWDSRRGHAKGTLPRAVRNRSTLRKTKGGYRFDITRSSKRVRNYWRNFRDDKTLGNLLATLKKGWPARHRNAIRKKLQPLLRELVKSGFDLKGKADIVMEMESVISRLPKRLLPKNARRRRL